MNEPRWYCVSNNGSAELCFSQSDAEKVAEDNDAEFPIRSPHRAVQLVDAAEIERLEAEIAILTQKNPNGDRNPSPGDPCGRSCEGKAYRIELRQALEQNEQQAKEVEALRGFAQDIMEFWPHSELEGGDLQDFAAKHGLLEPETRTERCGENCICDIDSPFWVCYRKTELLTGQ